MAKGKKGRKKKARPAAPPPPGPAGAKPSEPSTVLAEQASPERPLRLPRPQVTLVQALIALAMMGALTGLFSILPLDDVVHSREGRALLGLAAGVLGVVTALLWGMDLVVMRGYARGWMRRLVLGSALLFPAAALLGMLLMRRLRGPAVVSLLAAAAMLLFLISRDSGLFGDSTGRRD